MGLNPRAWLGRLPKLDLRRPRVVTGLAMAALAVAVGGFLLGALVAPVLAERSAVAQAREWTAQLAQQRQAIAAARGVLGEQVGALATRVGQMHARLMRLDALGKRLTEAADLDRGEFDFDSAPALGGPESSAAAGADGAGPDLPGMDAMLDSLSATIDDRSRQLEALETLILSRELARQIVPGGRPVESGYISSRYGNRPDPFNGKSAFHAGIDFAGAPGTRVLVVADGVVSFAGRDRNYGKLIEVTHGNGYVTRYAHNSTLLVEAGQTVRRGDALALMGSTGRSTGTHLHFEVLREGRHVNPMSFVHR